MSRRCVVTGGAGVIGQTLVEHLVENGDEVRVIDVLPKPSTLSDAVDYVQGDLVDIGTAAIRSFDPQFMFHLAATFERSEEAPEFWRENAHHNVAASAAVLEGAMQSTNLARYVFASSYLIYNPDLYLFAEPQAAPSSLSEISSIQPRNACGAAKLLHEMEVELASLADDVQFSAVSARIYRVYGRSSRDVISRWIRAAIRGEELSVYGVESTFDYVFADDVAEGLRRLADSDVTGVVNLASGRSRSVDEVLACLESHFPDLRTSERTPAEVYEASVADLGRLRSAIDWSPPTQLEAGIAGLVEHERDNARRGITSVRVREPVQASVLISSVGAKAHVVRGLRASLHSLNIDGKIWGADIDPQAPARSILDEYWEMPRLNELGVDHLADFCDEHRIRLIIPTRDGELPYYAAERDALRARGIFVPIGSPRSVELTGDKLAFARALDDANLSAIATATSLNDLRVSSSRYVVKQRSGSGSRALHIGIDADEAIRLLGDNDGLIVQPFVDGDEFSVDLYVTEDGRPAGSVARRRDRIVNGEAQITSIVDRPDLTRLAVDAAVAVGVRGHAVVQLIDATGGTQVIECNARVGGASSAAWSSGLRSLDAMLLEALGEVVTPMATVSAPLTQTRLPRDYVDWQ